MIKVKVQNGQTLIDIALQEYGCYEGIFLLMQDNGLSLTSTLVHGQELLVRDVVPELTPTNRIVVREFKKDGVIVNSQYHVPAPTPGGEPMLDFSVADNSMYLG